MTPIETENPAAMVEKEVGQTSSTSASAKDPTRFENPMTSTNEGEDDDCMRYNRAMREPTQMERDGERQRDAERLQYTSTHVCVSLLPPFSLPLSSIPVASPRRTRPCCSSHTLLRLCFYRSARSGRVYM